MGTMSMHGLQQQDCVTQSHPAAMMMGCQSAQGVRQGMLVKLAGWNLVLELTMLLEGRQNALLAGMVGCVKMASRHHVKD
mmetsp:Transcript_11120/g.18338  ORF Transcript_11120/g.18338 Transcript_11120/m.18338 type:complete len:80 (-) Transcript_11120:783-1022(-)